MSYCYTMLQSRSHAILLENRLKNEGIKCELTYMPRDISTDLCNLGVKFSEQELPRAAVVIRSSGLSGCRLFRETIYPYGSEYTEIEY